MKKIAALALVSLLVLGGCSWFGSDDEKGEGAPSQPVESQDYGMVKTPAVSVEVVGSTSSEAGVTQQKPAQKPAAPEQNSPSAGDQGGTPGSTYKVE